MNFLLKICERKRTELQKLVLETSLAKLPEQVEPCTTDVLSALKRSYRLQVIAEHKRKSPSKGVIRADSDPIRIAKGYEQAGAAAVSVLTDSAFDGRKEDLIAIRGAVTIPVLCKDFILSPLQVFLARSWGADIVLLIVAALKVNELKSLIALVKQLGMEPLVEVHDAHELKVATDCGARLVGVNNRNLHTFEVDLRISEELAPAFDASLVRVSESGIRTGDDLQRVWEAGYDAVLVGEQLMRAADPGNALEKLISEGPTLS